MRINFCANAVFALLAAINLVSCGSADSSHIEPSNLAPTIVALSPNSSKQGGPAFTLSVVGNNFIPSSTVQWNSISLQTTLISSQLLTAEVPDSALSSAGPGVITVANFTPGGGISNALNLAVPCVIDAPKTASTQSRARVGAFYFDGWSGPLTNFHFHGLPFGPYQDRQPLSGWQDNSTCAMEQQLAWAHNFGIDFFLFDWYYNAEAAEPSDNLNSAFDITRSLPDRHGMKYAMMYTNGPPFDTGVDGWSDAVKVWVNYMTDPDYMRVNGKPLFVFINVGGMRADFGSAAGVAAALDEFRAAAVAKGLPGVYFVGDFGPPDGTIGEESLDDGFSIAGSDGYDAITIWGYPFARTPVNGEVPFSGLSDGGHWTWEQAVSHSPLPYIPAVMDGWDSRPWGETSAGGFLMWYDRTPQDVATFLNDAIEWANANPQLRPEPPPAPPLVLITSWNEIGEGNHILPTVTEGTSYGDAIANVLMTTTSTSARAAPTLNSERQ